MEGLVDDACTYPPAVVDRTRNESGARRIRATSESAPGRGGESRAFVVAAVASLIVFAVVAGVVARSASFPGDTWGLRFLGRFEDTPVIATAVDVFSSDAVIYAGLAVFVAVLAALVANRRYPLAAFFLLSVAGSWTNPMLKGAFERAAPPEDGNFSGAFAFPSGHAMGSMALAAALTFAVWNTRYRSPVLVISGTVVVLTGFCVVIDNVHWPSDVVAGWAFSLAWSCAAWLVVKPDGRAPARDRARRTGKRRHRATNQ